MTSPHFEAFKERLEELLPVTKTWKLTPTSIDADTVQKALEHHRVTVQWHWMDDPSLQALLEHSPYSHQDSDVLCHSPQRQATYTLSQDHSELFDFQDLLILGPQPHVTLYHHQGRFLSLSIPTITPSTINFYSVADAFGAFSNFSAHPIRLKGKLWPTSEHYFQAQKFVSTSYEELIRAANTPMEAARMGRNRKWPLRRDWESVKRQVMYQAIKAKFTQHAELGDLLLSTGEAKLVEHTANDSYWGDGGDGKGHNWLGRLLMKLRRELQASSPDTK